MFFDLDVDEVVRRRRRSMTPPPSTNTGK
ncbi:hypothetical protein A2U01_0089809, partial [Trifolium medium]|nr:hypothetical protein [Trifolium medium]